jgi:hypothetical protein
MGTVGGKGLWRGHLDGGFAQAPNTIDSRSNWLAERRMSLDTMLAF